MAHTNSNCNEGGWTVVPGKVQKYNSKTVSFLLFSLTLGPSLLHDALALKRSSVSPEACWLSST